MIHINILSRSDRPFYPHWNKEKYPPSEYDIRENSDEDIEWDCVVIYQNTPSDVHFRCRAGNVLFFSGEPPMMAPCPHVFTKQFDVVVLPHPHVRHSHKIISHGFLNWSLGYGHDSHRHRYDYSTLSKLNPEKTKLISIVTSNQKMMPGHNKRMMIVQNLQRDFPNVVDIFGRGFNALDFKADALEPYMFHICIENSSINDYWTEKIADPILAQCVPIYAGCKNINQYLGEEGYLRFDVDDYGELKRIIEKILDSPKVVYEKHKEGLELLRKKIMEDQNLIPFVIAFLEKQTNSNLVKDYTIRPLESSLQYKFQLYQIRLKRLIYKTWYRLKNND